MTNEPANASGALTSAAAEVASQSKPVPTLNEIEQAVQRQMDSLLQRVKQTTLEVIDEVGSKHGSPVVTQLRQTLVDALGSILKTETATFLERLKPTVREGSDAVRQSADSLMADLKQFITHTVVDVFRIHVPDYSRWAGQRGIDYLLAGTLFCLAAVMLCVGAILGLEQAGLPAYASYLIGGGVALGAGAALLKLRSKHRAATSDGPGRGTPNAGP